MYEAAAPLRAAAPGVGWVRPEGLHLTVKFLGECPESAVEAIGSALTGAAAGHQPVPVVVGSVGTFPNFRRPRVVWMAVDGGGRLELLHHDMEVACVKLGYEADGRPFRPHVTLGRVRDASGEGPLREMARAARACTFRDEALVTSVDLMASELSRGGSRYALLASARLGNT
jgi:RNA 2',3'-cyclic 3'-phosphodiesterase